MRAGFVGVCVFLATASVVVGQTMKTSVLPLLVSGFLLTEVVTGISPLSTKFTRATAKENHESEFTLIIHLSLHVETYLKS